MTRYLKSTQTGVIFSWNERLAAHPDTVELTEREAFPERFTDVKVKDRAPKVEIKVPTDAVEAPPQVAPELLAEASKPFGKPNARPVKATKVDVAGLLGDF